MREKKFRAQVKESRNTDYKKGDWIYYSTKDVFRNIFGYRLTKIENECEYADLKDKNGKKIYKGDIIKNGKGIIYEVKWYNFGFHLDTPKIDNKWTSYTLEAYENIHHTGPSISVGMKKPKHYEDWDVEVIGNIYENPELLKIDN